MKQLFTTKEVNRPIGTGTRLLLDQELKKATARGEKIDGYDNEVHRHLDVGLEILAGRAPMPVLASMQLPGCWILTLCRCAGNTMT